MKLFNQAICVVTCLSGTAVVATPIDAISELSATHTWQVNGGSIPEGITMTNFAISLVQDSDIATAIDDPTAEETADGTFIVGNVFADPPIAVENRGLNFTTVEGSDDFTAANFDYTILSEDDPGHAPSDVIRREIEQSGFARAELQDNSVVASAMSSHVGARDFRFTNTTDELISFNIAGMFEAELSAVFDGAGGFAAASVGFELLFEVTEGASVAFSPTAPFMSTTTDTDPGAIVSDFFLANSGGITGLGFGASVMATGNGGVTEAAFVASSGYDFEVSLEGGASILFETSFVQSNDVIVDPAAIVPPVPLPASLPMLLAGFIGFAALRRQRAMG